MQNPSRLDALRLLRDEVKISQQDAAKFCGLTGNQGRISFGKWELGESIPQGKRRGRFIPYLWDHLRLRNNPQRFEATWNMLVEEWDWEPISDREWQQLTGASRTSTTVQSIATTLPSIAPASPAPFQAPGLVSHFVGRSKELAHLQTELLQKRAPSLYALVGMGGIGKTTLATSIAHSLRSYFTDGVLWGYAATGEALDILNHWAKAYGCDFSSQKDLQNRAAAVRGLLADKQALIVLDDVTSVDNVRPLLPNSQHCSVLLTTRNEEVAVGLGAQITRVDELLLEDGVAMLVQILGRERVENDEEEARKVCQRLNNLPLAVEIAAQHLKTRPRRSLAYLAERLDHAQQRLNLAIADRDVRASFLVSWETLDEAQRTLFSHMALFAGRPFTTEALAAIGELDVDATQDQLEALAALSLVKEEGDSYYRQHLLLADFAQEQLAQDVAHHNLARRQMASYYLIFAQENRANYARLEPEWDNIMASMEAAYRDGAWMKVIEYADVLTDAWLIHGEYERAKHGFTWAVEAAEKLDLVAALTQYHIRQGFLHTEQNQSADAERILRDALAMSEQLGDLPLIAQAQYELARLAVTQGEYEEVDQQLSNCCELFLQLKDELGWARATHLRAAMFYRISEYAQSEEICNRALAIYEKYNDMNGIAEVLRQLTDIRLMQFDHEQGECYADLALAHNQKYKIEAELGEAYINKAVLCRRSNALTQAIAFAGEAIVLFQRTGQQSGLANAYYEKSRSLSLAGMQKEAIDMALQSLWIVQDIQEHYNSVFCLSYLGNLYANQGNFTVAYNHLINALELAKNLHHPLTEKIEGQLRQLA